MPEEARINFYSIQRCGYYRHGTSESIIGNISGLLAQLQSWATRDELPLGSTCTFSPQDAEDNLLRTFCFDIKSNENTGDFFLTTWNETPSNEGKVPSVSSDRPVGAAQVHLNDIAEGTIPGYATYFWFIPQVNVFATIKFQHLLNGQPNLVKYLNGFLETFSDHAVTEQTDDDNLEIIGYRENTNSETQELYHSFKSKLLRKAGEIEFIRQKHASIRKIIRKSQLDLEIEEERSLISKMLLKVGITKEENDEINSSLKVQYSIPFSPTLDEVNDIINNALEEGLSWTNDIGVQLTGKTETYWLSNSIVKHEINLNIERDNDEIVNLDSLSTQLSNHRPTMLNIINGL